MNPNGTNDFNDFLNEYPKYSKFATNSVAKQVFDTLSDLQEIHNMISASNADKPALSACINLLESNYGSQSTFEFGDGFTKQAVGAMVKVILEPFGYVPVKQKRIPPTMSNYFTSASVYEKQQQPRLKIIQKLDIERVEE